MRPQLTFALLIIQIFFTALLSPHAKSAEPCAPGSFSATGEAPCEQASRGFYVPNPGATIAIRAEAGYYVPSIGATEQTPADPGFYVPEPGAFQQLPAEPGFYSPDFAATELIPADPGFYVPAGGTEQIPAEPGSYVPLGWTGTSAVKAEAGYYVPESKATVQIPADPGFYVPNPGANAQVPVEPGFYVQETGQSTFEKCPDGTFSYGAAVACRSVSADVPADFNVIVSPEFDSNYGQGGLIELNELLLNTAYSLDFDVYNKGYGGISEETDLTLLDIVFSGVNADLFSLVGFTSNSVIENGGIFDFDILIDSSAIGEFDVSMEISTDQFANTGFVGKPFLFNFAGSIVESLSTRDVPEPSSVFLICLASLLLLTRFSIAKRHCVEKRNLLGALAHLK